MIEATGDSSSGIGRAIKREESTNKLMLVGFRMALGRSLELPITWNLLMSKTSKVVTSATLLN